MTQVEIKGTEVLGVKSPTLEELKTRPCSLEEMQAALVQLVDVVNRNAKNVENLREQVERKSRTYGL